MKIGVMSDSFRRPFAEAAALAAKLGAEGLQTYAKSDTLSVSMTKAELENVKRIIRGEGLEFSAVCGDFGCDMFYRPEQCRGLIEQEKRVLELAKELGTDVVTTHIGAVPQEENCRQYETMQTICRELAEFADGVGGHFAVETGPEPAETLRRFLDSLHSRGVAVNLDPANLVMCSGDDPVRAVYILREYIVHTHAKDGIRKIACDPRRIYAPAYYGLEPAPEHCFEEVPLGKGGVSWHAYLSALQDIGYEGYLTIERECGDTPEKDIGGAVAFLREELKKL